MKYLIILFLACSANAATYFMSTTGNNSSDGSVGSPWLTLTKAAGAMRAGDTLFIRGGTYNCDPTTGTYQYFSPGYFTANGGAAGLGTASSPLVVSNYPGEVPLFINGNLSGVGLSPIWLGYNSWIKIFGLSFSNCNMTSINLQDSCTNMEIAYCRMGPSATNKRGAVFSYGGLCFSNYIHDNVIFESWSSEQVNAITGRQGESGDTASFGPSTWNTLTATNSAYNVFAFNHIYRGGHSAFNPQGSIHDYYYGNVVHNEGWIWWDDYGQLGGHRSAGSFAGYSCWDSNTFAYAGNPIANDGAEGLGIFGQFNIVRRNRIHHNENFGLTLYDKAVGSWHPNTNRVYNNTFAHNALGQMSQTNYYATTNSVAYAAITDLSGSKAAVFLSGSTNNVFINNIFAFNGGFTGTNGLEKRGATATSDANAFVRTNFYSNLNGDPLFVTDTNGFYYLGHYDGSPTNEAASNYRLQTNSPAINRGDWLTTCVGSSSGTTVTVADPFFFFAGITAAGTTFLGDTIQLSGTTNTSVIASIDYNANTLTLASSLTWTNGQGVALAYNGTAPDMGAFEFAGADPVQPIPPAQTNTVNAVFNGGVYINNGRIGN